MRNSSVLIAMLACGVLVLTGWPGVARAATQLEVAKVVRDSVLAETLNNVTLWMTEGAHDTEHVAIAFDPSVPDTLPYAATWVVMVDSTPEANWGHSVIWVYVNDNNLSEWTVVSGLFFPPTIFSDYGAGGAVPFGCVDLTALGSAPCPDYDLPQPPNVVLDTDKDCLYAVLISGGINANFNYSRYPSNLMRMYQILRRCGYPKANIFVYYANGDPLDLDDLDNDGNHATGSDVTGTVNKAGIRAKIKDLCATLNLLEDILFIYTTNHGSPQGLSLWDFNGSGTQNSNEVYTPTELGDDTKDCRVCQLYMILDQCYSGLFLGIGSGMDHWNTVVYTAANSTESSWGTEYLDAWDDNDPSTTTMNDMHDAVVAGTIQSNPGRAIATGGMGETSLCDCCSFEGQQIISESDSIHCQVETANDLHITYWSDTPMHLSATNDGPFPTPPTVVYTTGPGWRFNYELTWSGYTITYCNWLTVGAEFTQRSANELHKEDGYWTMDGVKVGNDLPLPGMSVVPPFGADPLTLSIYNDGLTPITISETEIGYPSSVLSLSEMAYAPGTLGEISADSIEIEAGSSWDSLLVTTGIPVSVMIQGYAHNATGEVYYNIQHQHDDAPTQCQPPTIDPSPNDVSVPRNGNITVAFDSDMDPATINDSSFIVYGSLAGFMPGTITYDAPTHTATWDGDDFGAGEQISMILTPEITGVGEAGWCGPIIAYGYAAANDHVPTTDMGEYEVFWSLVGHDPRGETTGDLNGDGFSDIAITDNGDNTISVMMNSGGPYETDILEPRTAYSVGSGPWGICSGDFNRDGSLDIAVANNGSSEVSILMNNGDSTFDNSVEYYIGQGPKGICSADLNGDGYLDIVTGNSSSNVSVLLNDGSGGFPTHTEYATPSDHYAIYVADVDGDFVADIIAPNYNSASVSVFLGLGDGTFGDDSVYATGSHPASVVVVDILPHGNPDGFADIAVGDWVSNTVSVLANNGDGTFAPRSIYPVAAGPHALCAWDFEGDGDMDLATANFHADSISILINDSSGFVPYQTAAVGDGPVAITSADFNGDGIIDLATANYNANTISILLVVDAACCGVYTGGFTGNTDCDTDGKRNLSDITRLIDRVYVSKADLCCEENGDIADPPDAKTNLADITALIDHVYVSKQETAPCN